MVCIFRLPIRTCVRVCVCVCVSLQIYIQIVAEKKKNLSSSKFVCIEKIADFFFLRLPIGPSHINFVCILPRTNRIFLVSNEDQSI